jgi:hypothetical protein
MYTHISKGAGRIHGLLREELAAFLRLSGGAGFEEEGEGKRTVGSYLDVDALEPAQVTAGLSSVVLCCAGMQTTTIIRRAIYTDIHPIHSKHTQWERLRVPDSTLAKPSSWCFDIIAPSSTRFVGLGVRACMHIPTLAIQLLTHANTIRTSPALTH